VAFTTEEAVVERPEPGAGDLLLEGAAADAYVARLRRAIDLARPNAHFPPARPLGQHLSFLGPAGSAGVHPELRLSSASGLPTTREILRVKIDRDLCAGFLAEAACAPAPPLAPLARRIEYYGRLARCEVMPMNRMSIELRCQIPEEGRALLRVVLDRFDLGSGMFVRYTILLAQRDSYWRRPHVVIDDADLAAPTEGFRRLIGKLAAHEAELAFILLSGIDGIQVEDVRRCRVGPWFFPGMPGLEGALRALLEGAEDPPWILCLPEDRAGTGLGAHSAGDPLSGLYREALSEPARELVDGMSGRLGYRVAKSRKFVCPASLAPGLKELCRAVGAPSVVVAA
jgi:hypothetical protein